jgi:hypothetical protein
LLIDLRQHIISLVAVFLALGVGIAVGSSFINGSSIERQISRKMDVSLQKEFGKLRADNDEKQQAIADLSEQLKRHSEFDRAVSPILTDGQLSGKRVAIIQTGDYSEATEDVSSALEQAGAVVSSKTVVFDLSSHSLGGIVRSITGEKTVQDPKSRALAILANGIGNAHNRAALDAMENRGLISCSGDYSRRVNGVVIVGGSRREKSDRPKIVDYVLIDKLKTDGVTTVVGVEPSICATSYVPVFRNRGISTVDDVDQPIGQIALVFCVRGDAGNYGFKATAERVVPAFLESGQWQSKSR